MLFFLWTCIKLTIFTVVLVPIVKQLFCETTVKCPTHSLRVEKSVQNITVEKMAPAKRKKKASRRVIQDKKVEVRRCSTEERWNMKINKVKEEGDKKQVELLKKEVSKQMEKLQMERARISKLRKKEDLQNRKDMEQQKIAEKKEKIKERLAAERKKHLEDLKAEEDINREETEKKALEAEKRVRVIVEEVKHRLLNESAMDQLMKDEQNSHKMRDDILVNAPRKWHPSLIGLGLTGLKDILQKENLRVITYAKHIEDENERRQQTSSLLHITDRMAQVLDGVMILESRLKIMLNKTEWLHHKQILSEWLKHHQPHLLHTIMEDMYKYGVLIGKELNLYNFLRRYDISMESFFEFCSYDYSTTEMLPSPVIRSNISKLVTESFPNKSRICIRDRQPFGDSHTLTYKRHRRSKFTSFIQV